jgi:Xaa-Pro aminopeptidase
MSAPAEPLTLLPEVANKSVGDTGSDRRFDIDGKQLWVKNLLEEIGCDGLLVLAPANFAWLTSGGCSRGILDPAQWPVLFFTAEHRCVIASNVETQRLFDEEVDGLGFQLKEWPWYWGREKLLADLCFGRRVASDEPFGDCRPVADQLKQRRRTLTPYEQACLRALGQVVSHALEATCRNMTPTQTEREVAGQLGHRLIHRGAHPVSLSVAAGGRSRTYRLYGYTPAVVGNFCVVTATARKYGLYATASRSVSFGPVDAQLRREAETACKVCASYIGASWPDAVPKAILSAGRRVFQISDDEHEWRLCPQGHVTGRAVVELPLLPQTEDLLQSGWALTWQTSVGAAFGCDTVLITDHGPEMITPTEGWPQTRVRYHGADVLLPFLLER